jgi:uncharacterized protein (DUF302 family)
MIEAMACGTPVIAYRRGSVPELVEEDVSGFVVDTAEEAVSAVRRIRDLDRVKVRAASSVASPSNEWRTTMSAFTDSFSLHTADRRGLPRSTEGTARGRQPDYHDRLKSWVKVRRSPLAQSSSKSVLTKERPVSSREPNKWFVGTYLSRRHKMHFFSTYVSVGFVDAVAAAKEALKHQEFAILAEIDMRQVLRERLSVDLRPYLILSACSLPLAHRAIKADDAIGSMLLCEVVIQERGNGCTEISVADPACTIGTINHVEMISIAQELQWLLRKVMANIEVSPSFHRAA